jgi:uncharacterized protein
MDRKREIKEWCEQVAKEFRPEKIILFGSRAFGTQTEDSDVDLLVVMALAKGERAPLKAAVIRNRVHAPFPMDLVVRSTEDIRRRVAEDDGFIKDVLARGVVLYEAEHA